MAKQQDKPPASAKQAVPPATSHSEELLHDARRKPPALQHAGRGGVRPIPSPDDGDFLD
jgi:hypothetical protein